ncbi:MAG: 30S ribosomal protein S17 [Planctomycetota bacterium]
MAKKIEGKVLSDKNDKTRIIAVQRVYSHPKFDKVIKMTKKVHAHDENNISKQGDRVVIAEARPKSRLKRWSVVRVI